MKMIKFNSSKTKTGLEKENSKRQDWWNSIIWTPRLRDNNIIRPLFSRHVSCIGIIFGCSRIISAISSNLYRSGVQQFYFRHPVPSTYKSPKTSARSWWVQWKIKNAIFGILLKLWGFRTKIPYSSFYMRHLKIIQKYSKY